MSVLGSLSDMKNVGAGVPQGAVLSPTLFNIFTADVKNHMVSSVQYAFFADDSAIYCASEDVKVIVDSLQNAINELQSYWQKWGIKTNESKVKAIFITRRRAQRYIPTNNSLKINGTNICWSNEIKYLGMVLDKRLTFKNHFSYVTEKAEKIIRILYGLINRKSKLKTKIKKTIYVTIIRPLLLYGCEVWRSVATSNIKKLQLVQNKILKLVYNKPRYYSTARLHRLSEIPLISQQINIKINKFISRCTMADNEIINNLTLF